MDRYFRKQLNKKGFTTVELLIVIAIIGVLLAMILPNMFKSDKPTKGKGYAKSFYYTAQDFFARQRIADSDGELPAFTNQYLFYVSTNSSGVAIETGYIPHSYGGTFSDTVYTAQQVIDDDFGTDDFQQLMSKFNTEMLSNTIASTEYTGTFYVSVDGNYVVSAAYWADGTWGELLEEDASMTFDDDNMLNGYYCCAYPPELSSIVGDTPVMFEHTSYETT